ncbi:FUSC family protein [Burkholderia oklahomensis]|uniref:FUSC family protein n=2 Tax=Burkholderia oklahomensis TaxID=342113 RepID=UPI0005D88105|nr:FUSC family protein [Burkholderia oklahomensis]AJX36039.1 fusaric acid resistance family protein [Burkholderia oklahomensis C6786]AOI49918.1 fusaric acid resistance protein [Burkholderia oklahomensis C6786]KUY53163.1 fusaric acid resistance protein [Burkholderia oklahomensis C6786]MBI0364214.1 FUSC family protein [Burkholderia oklahomensis]SUY28707.1 p-hydroxybenzoic acid efflux pump subunit AaeB [Burkholderia oklahomensis]
MRDAADQTAAVAAAPGRVSRAAAALVARIDLFTARGAYIARSIVAAALALGVAYLLELETPYSAASTVLLVINPVQGAVIGKGVWRVVGTIAGMLVAFVLMGLFAQKPLLFILGFGFWLGLCVAGMTLLRHFRASGTVVAGYTIGLATYGAMQRPALTFEHVIGRGSTVVIGVLCLSLVSMLLSTRDVRAKLEALVTRLAAAVARAVAAQRGGIAAAPGDDKRLALLADIYGIDDLLALGKAESEDLAQRAMAVRHGMASLFGALAGGAPPLPADSPSARAIASLQPRLEAAWQAAADALADGPGGTARAVALLGAARARFQTALAEIAFADPRDEAALLIAGERLLEQIDDYLAALRGLAELQRPRPYGKPAPVRFHRDVRSAVQNGVRSMCAIVITGAIWIATGWDQGDMMLLVVAPYCALLATAGNPAAGAKEFIKGTVVAAPAAFVCAFGILPRIEGFPLLAVTLALFWLPGIYATSVPKTALAGLAYLVAFNTLNAAANPFHPDVGLFFNQSVAWLLATFITLLTFQLILPRNLAADIARLRRTVRDDALALLADKRPAASEWQQRQQHRIAQLGALLKSQPAAMTQAAVEGLAALHVGKELLRIRRFVARDDLPAPALDCARAGLARLARRAAEPARAAMHARRAARAIARLVTAHPGHDAELKRLMAAFADVYVLLHTHAAYFTPAPETPRRAQ